MARVRRDYGVIVAQVNLEFIWDVVSQIQVGVPGRTYVVDSAGRLIAHPDIGMVLRNTDLSRLAQVPAAFAEGSAPPSERLVTDDIEGWPVLSAAGRRISIEAGSSGVHIALRPMVHSTRQRAWLPIFAPRNRQSGE